MAQLNNGEAVVAEGDETYGGPPSLTIIDRLNDLSIFLPAAARGAIRHLMGWSASSQYIDLRSAIMVSVVRSASLPQPHSLSAILHSLGLFTSSLTSSPSGVTTVTDAQRLLRVYEVKGPIWVSNYTAPGAANAAENAALRDALVDVVKRMHYEEGEGRNGVPLPDIKWPDVNPVEAEWTGYRTGARSDAKLPTYTDELERYDALMSHVTAPQPTTVLYLHGGAMYLSDPSTHRNGILELAKRINGRCYSVRYRLAPQAAFPAQILDALVSYLTMLYPPPGAFHEPVSPAHIVFAGDCAGANLCLALTRVLLDFQRNGTRVPWYGSRREVPLPAGVALNSPWLDITSSSPSCEVSDRAEFDVISPLSLPGTNGAKRPVCSIWPATPPRPFFYADTGLVTHPLVTLILSTPEGWRGMPPVYLCSGWELLGDEMCYFTATHLRGIAPAVVFEQYEAMPHCFAFGFQHLPNAARCFDSWAGFIRQATERPEALRPGAKGPGVGSSFTFIESKTLKESPIDLEELIPYSEATIRGRISETIARIKAEMAAAAKDTAKL